MNVPGRRGIHLPAGKKKKNSDEDEDGEVSVYLLVIGSILLFSG